MQVPWPEHEGSKQSAAVGRVERWGERECGHGIILLVAIQLKFTLVLIKGHNNNNEHRTVCHSACDRGREKAKEKKHRHGFWLAVVVLIRASTSSPFSLDSSGNKGSSPFLLCRVLLFALSTWCRLVTTECVVQRKKLIQLKIHYPVISSFTYKHTLDGLDWTGLDSSANVIILYCFI